MPSAVVARAALRVHASMRVHGARTAAAAAPPPPEKAWLVTYKCKLCRLQLCTSLCLLTRTPQTRRLCRHP